MSSLTKPLPNEDLGRDEDIEIIDESQRVIKEFPLILTMASLKFKDSERENIELKPMVRCVDSIQMNELIRHVMYDRWRLNNPRIVVFILSNIGSVNNWTNDKQIRSFQKGLMKAAESTDMWVITNGLDMGATTIVGNAISNYVNELKYKKLTSSAKTISKLNFIGIADENSLNYLQSIKSKESLIELERQGNVEHKYYLNQNLTHYVLIKDQTLNKDGVNKFLNNFMIFLAQNQKPNIKESEELDEFNDLEMSEVPVVSIVLKGGYECSRLVLQQIQTRLPVVVLRGSGGLADLLAFVDTEIKDRCLDVWDPDFVDMYLKPELRLKIVEMFPNLRNNSLICNQLRNRILESIRLSRKGGQNYLTVINMLDTYSCNLENLTEYLLLGVFKSQTNERTALSTVGTSQLEITPSEALIHQDLKLCVDWNCPEVAKKEVLSKDPTFLLNNEKLLFEESLIRFNRWQFVDLFLSQKFKLRSFVSPKRLKRMFQKLDGREFFTTVCWEGILGMSPQIRISDQFLYREFNWLIEACTGIPRFIGQEELDSYVTQQFLKEKRDAERRALELIVFWAVFDFRKQLVRILWKHSDQPIHLALMIAMTYDRLAAHVSEQSVAKQLREESKVFVRYGCDVLDAIYSDSARRAEQVLNERTEDWRYKTPVDLAALGKFKAFLSHESCQRWITSQISGNITIRDARFGYIKIPSMFKLVLSAYLLFPIYWFISVKTSESNSQLNENSDINNRFKTLESSDSIIENEIQIKRNIRKFNKKPNLKPKENILEIQQSMPPFPILVYELWTAPITKFWNYQFFYMFYLSIFSVAVLYPRCGHFYLDLVVVIWSALIVADSIRQTYLIHVRNYNYSLVLRVFEISIQIIFLLFYFSTRLVLRRTFTLQMFDPYYEKVVLCLALLHAYYLLFTVFLPISATLGPLLFRLRIMLLVDFLNFIRLSALVIISFGVVIQAILYPDLAVNMELFRRAFHRGFFSLFQSFTYELEVDTDCEENKRWDKFNDTPPECTASTYSSEMCPVTGFWPYFFEVLYYVLLKMNLLTLLMAIFASSATRLTADTDSIWKFQRYGLVMDFVTRSPFPPPINVFYFIFITFRKITYFCYFDRDFGVLKNIFSVKPPETDIKLSEDDYFYLRILAADIYEQRETKLTSDTLASLQWERIKANSEELESERRVLRQLTGKVSEMDRGIRHSLVYLESIKHLTTKKTGIESGGKTPVHILSRHSPYPYTKVQRYPVPDRYVSWDVMYIDYDPITYTRPKHEFSSALQPYVDSDLLAIQLKVGTQHQIMPVLEWNRVSVSGGGVTTDRQSWELVNNKPLIYKLEDAIIPVNPMGRTGLRGRGSLLRWGPNHYICLVITRLSSNSLEVLMERLNIESNTISLIVRFISGDMTYVSMETLFKTNDSPHKGWTDSQKMIDYFIGFDESIDLEANVEQREERQLNIKYSQLSRGYFDDPLNTDHAWKETELWNIHYVNQNSVLNNNINDCLEWREVTESLFSVLSLSQSKVLQGIVDKLDVSIR